MDELVENDYLSICSLRFQSIPRSLLSKLVLFNKRLHEETVLHRKFAQDGSPWEFNLRDVTRSCQILEGLIYFPRLHYGILYSAHFTTQQIILA